MTKVDYEDDDGHDLYGPDCLPCDNPKCQECNALPVCKVGGWVVDPQNRVLEIFKVEGELITVKLGGSYGATVQYPRSVLRTPR